MEPLFYGIQPGLGKLWGAAGDGSPQAGGRSAPTRLYSPSIEREGQVIYFPAFHHESGRLKVTLDLAGLESRSVLTPS